MSAEYERDWLCEQDVAYRSGLPGPLVADLIPRLPTPVGVDYHDTAQVYTEDSVYRSRLALLMLRKGIRLRYIQFVMREPMTRAELKGACRQWAAIPDKARPTATAAARRGPPAAKLLDSQHHPGRSPSRRRRHG